MSVDTKSAPRRSDLAPRWCRFSACDAAILGTNLAVATVLPTLNLPEPMSGLVSTFGGIWNGGIYSGLFILSWHRIGRGRRERLSLGESLWLVQGLVLVSCLPVVWMPLQIVGLMLVFFVSMQYIVLAAAVAAIMYATGIARPLCMWTSVVGTICAATSSGRYVYEFFSDPEAWKLMVQT